jgi:hypothetical protein
MDYRRGDQSIRRLELKSRLLWRDRRCASKLNFQKLLRLVWQPKPITNRRFEIEFLAPGLEAFMFD